MRMAMSSLPYMGMALVCFGLGWAEDLHGLVVDGTHAYWTVHDKGLVMKVPKSGGIDVTLASNQAGAYDIAHDAEAIYWTSSQAGTVMKLAK